MFKQYKCINVAEMRPVTQDEVLSGLNSDISLSTEDMKNGSPKWGDWIARNPENHKDQWLVAGNYLKANFEVSTSPEKILGNTCASGATKNVKDIVFWGDGDTFKLISKASSQNEGWMKSTKGMQCGDSVVVQVTTQQRNPDGSYAVAEALTTVPNARIQGVEDDNGMVISRHIVSII